MSEKQKSNTANYRAKMRVDHEAKNIWILKTDINRLEELATEKGWFATTGRNAGSVNYQQAINETLKAGLSALGV